MKNDYTRIAKPAEPVNGQDERATPAVDSPAHLCWYQNANAFYVCINLSESYCPKEIQTRAVCINGDVGTALQELCL